MITIPIWLLTALVSFTATTIVCQAVSIISNRRAIKRMNRAGEYTSRERELDDKMLREGLTLVERKSGVQFATRVLAQE